MKIELAHDILARKVYEKGSSEDKARLRIESFVNDKYNIYVLNRRLLSNDDFEYILPFLDELSLSAEQQKFITLSEQRIERRKRSILGLIGIIFVSLLFLLCWAFRERLRAEKAERKYAQSMQRLVTVMNDNNKISPLNDNNIKPLISVDSLSVITEKLEARISEHKVDSIIKTSQSTIEALNKDKAKILNEYKSAQKKLDAKTAQYLVAEADLSLQRSDYVLSFRLLEEALKKNPQNQDAQILLLQVNESLERFRTKDNKLKLPVPNNNATNREYYRKQISPEKINKVILKNQQIPSLNAEDRMHYGI